jgi:hypothetical protein
VDLERSEENGYLWATVDQCGSLSVNENENMALTSCTRYNFSQHVEIRRCLHPTSAYPDTASSQHGHRTWRSIPSGPGYMATKRVQCLWRCRHAVRRPRTGRQLPMNRIPTSVLFDPKDDFNQFFSPNTEIRSDLISSVFCYRTWWRDACMYICYMFSILGNFFLYSWDAVCCKIKLLPLQEISIIWHEKKSQLTNVANARCWKSKAFAIFFANQCRGQRCIVWRQLEQHHERHQSSPAE